MICHYCQHECEIYQPSIPSAKMRVWQCTNCKGFASLAQDDSLMYHSWRFYIGDREYYIKCYDGCTGNAPEFVIYYYVTSLESKHYWEEVKRFDFVPKDWTPQNSAHKLKTYLPFL